MSGGTSATGSQATNPTPSAGGTTDVSSQGKHLSIATSSIIAAIWAGLWGFNWAASHLSQGALFVSIMVGLACGTGLTVYLVNRTFDAMKALASSDTSVDISANVTRAP